MNKNNVLRGILAGLMVFSLSSCSKDEPQESNNQNQTNNNQNNNKEKDYEFSYEWSSDYKCTAKATNKNDTSDVITETVQGVYAKTKSADCVNAEEGVYSASFTNTLFEAQNKAATIGVALGHSFESDWSYDDNVHYHKSTCGHNVRDGEASHNIVSGVCTVCGYIQESSGDFITVKNSIKDTQNEQGSIYIEAAQYIPTGDIVHSTIYTFNGEDKSSYYFTDNGHSSIGYVEIYDNGDGFTQLSSSGDSKENIGKSVSKMAVESFSYNRSFGYDFKKIISALDFCDSLDDFSQKVLEATHGYTTSYKNMGVEVTSYDGGATIDSEEDGTLVFTINSQMSFSYQGSDISSTKKYIIKCKEGRVTYTLHENFMLSEANNTYMSFEKNEYKFKYTFDKSFFDVDLRTNEPENFTVSTAFNRDIYYKDNLICAGVISKDDPILDVKELVTFYGLPKDTKFYYDKELTREYIADKNSENGLYCKVKKLYMDFDSSKSCLVVSNLYETFKDGNELIPLLLSDSTTRKVKFIDKSKQYEIKQFLFDEDYICSSSIIIDGTPCTNVFENINVGDADVCNIIASYYLDLAGTSEASLKYLTTQHNSVQNLDYWYSHGTIATEGFTVYFGDKMKAGTYNIVVEVSESAAYSLSYKFEGENEYNTITCDEDGNGTFTIEEERVIIFKLTAANAVDRYSAEITEKVAQ